jgi:hypothetical protein
MYDVAYEVGRIETLDVGIQSAVSTQYSSAQAFDPALEAQRVTARTGNQKPRHRIVVPLALRGLTPVNHLGFMPRAVDNLV